MIETSSQKVKKQSRYCYFSISIKTGKSYRLFDSNILESFRNTQFVTQKVLERTLQDLVIQEGKRRIHLRNFIGHLERPNLQVAPYWKISCQTSSLTTAPAVARALSKALYSTIDSNLLSPKNLIDPRIKIYHQEELEEIEKEFQIVIPDSDWYPGYFSKRVLTFLDFMEESEISPEKFLQVIHKRPKVRNILIEQGKALETDDLSKQLVR